MMKTTTLAALIASALAVPSVVAQDAQQFSLPQGCEAYLTIQTSSCSVSHHFTCDFDAAGEQRRATLDEEGLSYIGKINSEAEWVESFHLRSGHTEQLSFSADRMMMTDLLAGDVDTWDFTTSSDEIGETQYVGFDQLTGEAVTIDGVDLLRTEYALTAFDEDGTEIWRAEGREFVNAEWRMFIGGVSSYTTSEGTFDSDDTPVEFIFPGEEGFLSQNPKHGCGVELSSAELNSLITATKY
ncbi:hypothetical protein [Pseudooctadecabacter jejudonensis]|uniref:Uncharacterized protein n=1 Tax=Pseudooctadecabacter jejudonensis TaxID=1391910 RepID=A0A1Y5S9F2_9RHOB|nr:hypothetical protein [Pseudooctadecabacter jejudonensis]SLN34365.1 hypothetical protein PSJ8397_01690 [Pseudooctadecabacter jejudonensis]